MSRSKDSLALFEIFRTKLKPAPQSTRPLGSFAPGRPASDPSPAAAVAPDPEPAAAPTWTPPHPTPPLPDLLTHNPAAVSSGNIDDRTVTLSLNAVLVVLLLVLAGMLGTFILGTKVGEDRARATLTAGTPPSGGPALPSVNPATLQTTGAPRTTTPASRTPQAPASAPPVLRTVTDPAVVDSGDGKPAASAPPAATAPPAAGQAYTIYLADWADTEAGRQQAQKAGEKLAREGGSGYIRRAQLRGGMKWALFSGRYATRDGASKDLDKIPAVFQKWSVVLSEREISR